MIKGDVDILLERLEYLFSHDFVHIHLINESTLFFDINLDELVKHEKNMLTEVISASPQVISEDFSLNLSLKTAVGPVLQKIKELDNRIYKVKLIGEPIERDGQKNILITVEFLSDEGSLSSQDIEPLRKKILSVS